MIVISTAFAPPIEAQKKCRASVLAQDAPHAHVYIDAAEQSPPRSHFENLLGALVGVPDDEIVVSLDGDDWLLPGALGRVQAAHDAGALVTYGSFVFADGRPGFAAPHGGRQAPWTATHLKTYRAGLLKRISRAHLTRNGEWLEHARDLAVMFPLLEMAGTRGVFIAEPLMVYNYANSTEFRGGIEMLAAERAAVAYVRSLPPYPTMRIAP